MQSFISKIYEGGPVFMVPILILLILILVLIVKGFIDRDKQKTIKLLSSLGLFTLVWGLLGQTIGLIEAFDAIQAAGGVSMPVMAGGLKVSLLTTTFGFITFLVSRLGVIALVWMQNGNNASA
jgi:hypothetical protein